ncbi:unnamed protein product [Schistocephalus solidus]|uniref:C2H2-type domain-containing protein n=1 Tax=Schistocephalus solidus TaxID=70667 RepID=A0A183T6J8_SCHSO|nr:unnamed protein product [Schistocephalus solidus]
MPGASAHIRDRHFHSTHRNVDSTDAPRTSSNPAITSNTTSTNTITSTITMDDNRAAPSNLSCPYCVGKLTSPIGLIGHVRIYRTQTGKPMPGAPTCSRRTRLHCPHCSRSFPHHIGLLRHMRLHDNLR